MLNSNDSGPNSLRQAILDANAVAGLDTIAFKIQGAGVKTIQVGSSLPALTDPVIIDGYTQPGSHPKHSQQGANAVLRIELDGTSAGAGVNGLTITAGNSTIQGLVINRFDGDGVLITGSLAMGNVVAGNYIGTDASGTTALGNHLFGVNVTAGASFNSIGGSTAAARNIISGNWSTGLSITGAGTNHNVVAGNYIGVTVDGDQPLGNGFFVPGFQSGIAFRNGASYNRIGTDGDGINDDVESNIVSANAANGIVSHSGVIPGATNNVIAGNYIGTNPSGANLGNGLRGITLFDGVQNTFVGTDANGQVGAATGNTIAFNHDRGVWIHSSPNFVTITTGHRVRGNSIYANLGYGSNPGLGIDLGGIATADPNEGNDGPTANDLGDGDPGPNNFQNYPVITNASYGLSTGVQGTLNSLANTTFTLDFYANSAADPTGYGEGQRYLGSGTVTTDGSGNVTFDSATFLTPLRWSIPGEWITATATDPAGNTSEFSLAFQTTLNFSSLTVTASTGSSAPGAGQATAALDHFFAERALTPKTDSLSADILSALLSLEKERGAGGRG